jgi:hypothetical protein
MFNKQVDPRSPDWTCVVKPVSKHLEAGVIRTPGSRGDKDTRLFCSKCYSLGDSYVEIS